MQRILKKALQAFACVAVALTLSTNAFAGPADGTWTWTTPGRNGGPDRTQSIKLKAEGDKITGEMAPFREGGEPIKITNGTIKGDEVKFEVSRPGRDGGPARVTKYTGKISGDSIKGKVTNTNQQGEEQSRDWEAKKKADAK